MAIPFFLIFPKHLGNNISIYLQQGLTILFKKGNGDERLAASIEDEVAFDTTYYTVIDKLTLETEYDYK